MATATRSWLGKAKARQSGSRVKCSFCDVLLKPKFRENHEAGCAKNPQRAVV